MRNSTIHSLIHNKNVDFLLSLARSFLHFIWLWEFFFLWKSFSFSSHPRVLLALRRAAVDRHSKRPVCAERASAQVHLLYTFISFFFFSSFLQRVRLYFFSVCWLLRRESDLFSLQLRHKNLFFLPWYIKCLSWSIAEDSEQWRIPLFFWSIISLHSVVPFLSSSSHSSERRFPRVECVKLTQK